MNLPSGRTDLVQWTVTPDICYSLAIRWAFCVVPGRTRRVERAISTTMRVGTRTLTHAFERRRHLPPSPAPYPPSALSRDKDPTASTCHDCFATDYHASPTQMVLALVELPWIRGGCPHCTVRCTIPFTGWSGYVIRQNYRNWTGVAYLPRVERTYDRHHHGR